MQTINVVQTEGMRINYSRNDRLYMREFSFSNRVIELTTCTVCKFCYY